MFPMLSDPPLAAVARLVEVLHLSDLLVGGHLGGRVDPEAAPVRAVPVPPLVNLTNNYDSLADQR